MKAYKVSFKYTVVEEASMSVMANSSEDAVEGAKTILEATNPDLSATVTEVTAEEFQKQTVN